MSNTTELDWTRLDWTHHLLRSGKASWGGGGSKNKPPSHLRFKTTKYLFVIVSHNDNVFYIIHIYIYGRGGGDNVTISNVEKPTARTARDEDYRTSALSGKTVRGKNKTKKHQQQKTKQQQKLNKMSDVDLPPLWIQVPVRSRSCPSHGVCSLRGGLVATTVCFLLPARIAERLSGRNYAARPGRKGRGGSQWEAGAQIHSNAP